MSSTHDPEEKIHYLTMLRDIAMNVVEYENKLKRHQDAGSAAIDAIERIRKIIDREMTPRKARVSDLQPGDTLALSQAHPVTAIHVATVDPHPLYPGTCLVVWRMSDGSWSHDSLSPDQVVGAVDAPRTETERSQRLRAALYENNPSR